MIKVLLIEDSKFLRMATQHALARAGYQVITAGNGEDALRMAREEQPDVILLDMLLPKIPGLDVLKALKSDPATAEIVVVVLTGMSEKNAERLRKDGAFAFLSKEELALNQGAKPLLKALAQLADELQLGLRQKAAAK
jgi:CheY-like chemotaxis protein